jgi:hypothetical protein
MRTRTRSRKTPDDVSARRTCIASHKTVNSYLGLPEGWPVIEDIGHAIVLMPNARDIRRGHPNNPTACALHNAACRTFNVPNCAIGAEISYIPQRDSKGHPYIARVRATKPTQIAIKTFDETGDMPEGGFVFTPVPESRRLENVRANEKIWRQTRSPKPRNADYSRKGRRAIPRAFTGEED